MTPRYSISPAADRDLDGQAGYLARATSLETALQTNGGTFPHPRKHRG
jgi:hypothetical protein